MVYNMHIILYLEGSSLYRPLKMVTCEVTLQCVIQISSSPFPKLFIFSNCRSRCPTHYRCSQRDCIVRERRDLQLHRVGRTGSYLFDHVQSITSRPGMHNIRLAGQIWPAKPKIFSFLAFFLS